MRNDSYDYMLNKSGWRIVAGFYTGHCDDGDTAVPKGMIPERHKRQKPAPAKWPVYRPPDRRPFGVPDESEVPDGGD